MGVNPQSVLSLRLFSIYSFSDGLVKGTMQLISQQRCTEHSQLKMHTVLGTGIKLLLITFLQAAKYHYIFLPHKCSLWCLMDQTVLPNKRVCNQSLKYTNSWEQEGHPRFVTSRENAFPHPCAASHHNAATTFAINHSSQMLVFPSGGIWINNKWWKQALSLCLSHLPTNFKLSRFPSEKPHLLLPRSCFFREKICCSTPSCNDLTDPFAHHFRIQKKL